MSAANRGSKRKESDYYATPRNAINSLLEKYHIAEPQEKILEPSAGNGIIIEALRDFGYTNDIYAIEIRGEERETLLRHTKHVSIQNYLDVDTKQKFNVIIGNPPFSLAQEFIDKSLELLSPGGRLIFLLRTNFLESKKRFQWWQDKFPTRLYVLSSRPSFTGKGTDATSYSWFVWEKSQIKNQFIKQQEIKVI